VTGDEFFWGLMALVLIYSAYVSEVYRAGIESIHPSQEAAARSWAVQWKALRFVIAPGGAPHHPAAPQRLHRPHRTRRWSASSVVEAFRRAADRAVRGLQLHPVVVTAVLFLVLTIPCRGSSTGSWSVGDAPAGDGPVTRA
jgi:polar amino acid transport system permease protein